MRAIFIIGASSISISALAIIAIGALRIISSSPPPPAPPDSRYIGLVLGISEMSYVCDASTCASDCSASELPVGLSAKESESGSHGSSSKSRSSLSAE